MASGTFGFKGFKSRALELPAGVTGGVSVEISPTGRARLRYNDVAKQIEQSVDGGAYTPLGGTGAGPWDQVGTDVYPDSSSWNVVVGATTVSGAEKFRVVGSSLFEGDVDVLNSDINMLGDATSTIGGGYKAPNTSPGKSLNYTAGEGGDTDGATPGGPGGNVQIVGAQGGDGTAGMGAGPGGVVTIYGGDAGLDGGGPGANGGNVVIRGGSGSGGIAGANVVIGDANTSSVDLGATATRVFVVGNLEMNDDGSIVMNERSADPGATLSQGKLYTKDVLGVVQLFYQRSDGTVVQLT